MSDGCTVRGIWVSYSGERGRKEEAVNEAIVRRFGSLPARNWATFSISIETNDDFRLGRHSSPLRSAAEERVTKFRNDL